MVNFFLHFKHKVHREDEDYIFFIVPASDFAPIMYGVACYRQIKATDDLKNQDAAVTR